MHELTSRLRRIANRLHALSSERLKAPLVWRVATAAFEALKLLAALIYFVFDELGIVVKWLRLRFRPLDLYFDAIKRLAYVLRVRGLGSPDAGVRAATPYLTLPFVLIPISLLLPAKVYFLHLIAKSPLYAIPALLLAKLFSAIFVKQTWDILRPIGRRNPRIRAVDDRWQRLEQWAKRQLHGVVDRLKHSASALTAREYLREALARLRPMAQIGLAEAGTIVGRASSRLRARIARWRAGREL